MASQSVLLADNHRIQALILALKARTLSSARWARIAGLPGAYVVGKFGEVSLVERSTTVFQNCSASRRDDRQPAARRPIKQRRCISLMFFGSF